MRYDLQVWDKQTHKVKIEMFVSQQRYDMLKANPERYQVVKDRHYYEKGECK